MSKTADIIKNALNEGRTFLLENESKTIISEYGIPTTVFEVAASPEEAVTKAEKIGYPVVLKILSPDIIHKSDAGGVITNLKNADEVKEAYNKIIENAKKYKPDAKINGVFIQEFAPLGIEIIIGMVKDPQFGPAIMFGLGGIFVEVLKDVSFRVAPLTDKDAEDMIHEIKGYPLLTGIRGQKPADIEALKKTLVGISKLVMDYPQIKELDLNPVFAYPDGVKCIDARIILEK